MFLAALVGYHRRDIPEDYADDLPGRLRSPLRHSLLCMRLACIFCRTREDDAIPDIRIARDTDRVSLELPAEWMKTHPLTIADLEYEVTALRMLGLDLDLSFSGHDGR